MKRTINILLFFAMSGLSVHMLAQTQKNKEEKKEQAKKIKYTPVYLGDSDKSGGEISEKTFDALLKKGISARDSAGIAYRVNGFMFTYGERTVYEDSIGNLMYVTDYLAEYCSGDTLTSYIGASLYDRTKPGDTVYFDQITLTSPEGKSADGRAMRFILKK